MSAIANIVTGAIPVNDAAYYPCRDCGALSFNEELHNRAGGTCSGEYARAEIDARLKRKERLRAAIRREMDTALKLAIDKVNRLSRENEGAIDERAPIEVSVKFNFFPNKRSATKIFHEKLSTTVARLGNFLKWRSS